MSVSIRRLPRLGSADEDARGQHEQAAENDLKNGPPDRRLHKAMLDPDDGPKLHEDDAERDRGGGPEIRNEIGQGVSKPAECGHDAGSQSALPRRPPSRQFAIVMRGFRE